MIRKIFLGVLKTLTVFGENMHLGNFCYELQPYTHKTKLREFMQ